MTDSTRPRSPEVPVVDMQPEGSSAKRVRRTKAEQRAETLEQILDAAEYLFSRNGLHGVTLRDVAKRVEESYGNHDDAV